jgi:hypothetical protein
MVKMALHSLARSGGSTQSVWVGGRLSVELADAIHEVPRQKNEVVQDQFGLIWVIFGP